MRCRNATRLIGPYIDGELPAPLADEFRRHLAGCAGCSRRYERMRGLVRELSALPAILPAPEESYRLMNRVRREMEAPPVPAVPRRGRIAVAAMSLLVMATVAGLSIAIWSGRNQAPVTDGTVTEAERSSEEWNLEEGDEEAGLVERNATTGVSGDVPDARPALVTTGEEYTTAELQDFRNDVGTRIDFYSAYWYPAPGSSMEQGVIEQLQQELASDLIEQAAAAGEDPVELERAVTAAVDEAGDEPVLPCYAELVRIGGGDAWLVSFSGPEDYLLFSDPKHPPAFVLASLGGKESLRVSESLLRELAARLAPSGSGTTSMVPAGTLKNDAGTDSDETISGETVPAPETDRVESPAETGPQQTGDDFQSFLRELAARGTSLDLIYALKNLNYEQLLMLLHGDWASLASDGVNLSDFLAPPKRLWAVDCATGEVLWRSR